MPSRGGPDHDAVGTRSSPFRVAFVVDVFPLVSETFVIDQVAGLLDRGIEVEIFSFTRGDESNVSRKYFEYDMRSRVAYLEYPLGKASRFIHVWPRVVRLARRHPRILVRAVNVMRHGSWALSLKLLYYADALAGKTFDVVHCHFGTVAHDFVRTRQVVGLEAPLVTTFYGVDVSRIFATEPPDYYDELKDACSLYFVMSEDMRRRVIARGFPAERVRVHPVGVEVDDYPFHSRSADGDGELRLVAVGRFVEKKGFDDLLRALAVVKKRSARPVSCVVVGGGPLEGDLRRLADALELHDTVRFAGLMPIEEIIDLFGEMHVLVTPSKTAADGDME